MACYRSYMDESLKIEGPSGVLEARFTAPDNQRLAVLCHPHPLYGGSMDDGVLGTLRTALSASGIGALRFNFRGVGMSAGQHDGNGGEVEDLKAVLAWSHARHPDCRILLGGYSFGASTICQLLAEGNSVELERVLLVAPPVGGLPTPAPDGQVLTDVFAGDADQFVDQDALSRWDCVHLHTLAGADHFFSGHWHELEAKIRAALT